VGVPARLGRAGIEEIVELKLTEAESAALRRSAESVRSGCALLEKLLTPGS